MKEIVTDNSELLEVLEANGINIICSDDMRMMVTDTDAMRIYAIVADKAPAAFADYIICQQPKGKKKIQTIKLQSDENNQQQHQTGRALY